MKASLNPTALFLVSLLALVWNIAVFVNHFAKVFKCKRNIAVGVHSDVGEYKELASERGDQAPTSLAAPGLAAKLQAI